MINILVAEDEFYISNLIKISLTQAGYNCITAEDGEEALKLVEKEDFDLALLDIMMPKINGYELLEFIRAYKIPVIFITAKSSVSDKVKGLKQGAEDYITKPFNPLEVVARVKTQLRRYKQYNTNAVDTDAEPTEYDEKGLYICPASHKCTLNGEVLPLTPFEFNILWYLCKNHGRVVSAEELFETVWGEKFFESNNNTVMAHIARIREKMKEPPRKPKYIKTVWVVGYTIE